MSIVHRGDCFNWVPGNIAPGSVDLVIVDPPYGKIVTETWDQTWSIRKQMELTSLIFDALCEGGTAYVWGGIGKPGTPRIFFEWLSKLEIQYGFKIWDVITWSKKRAYGTSNRYLFTREECAMLVKGDKPKTFNVPLLDEERGYAGYNEKYPAKSKFLRRTNVWTDVSELFRGKIHPCEKPSRLAEIMIKTSSNSGDLVLDPMAGAGGVGVAAAKLGRECILVEQSNCPMREIA